MKTTVKGREIEYGVDDNGIFKTMLEGERFEHKTLAGLKAAVERRLSQRPISIPVVRAEGVQYRDSLEEKLVFRRGTVTGIHSGNGNAIVKWDDSERVEQITRWHGERLFTGNVDLKKFEQLHKRKQAAETALCDFERENRFDPSEITRVEQDREEGNR